MLNKTSLIRKIISRIFDIKTKDDLINAINRAAINEIINKTSQNMLIGAMNISSLDVGDIMISHTKIIAVDMSMSVKDMLEKTINSSHTRLPVYCESRCEVLGILHSKDLLKLIFEKEIKSVDNEELLKSEDIKKILRPTIFIPETKKLNVMLKDFKNSQNHIAIVVDEYGAISGLITIEDVLEKIVGNIEDEFDTTSKSIFKMSNNKFIVDATTSIEDFNNYFSALISENNYYNTIAGMIIQDLECLPKKGDTVIINCFKFTVQEADDRRILKILVEKIKNNEKVNT